MSILHPQAGFQYVCLTCQVATTPEITDLGVAERVMEEATQLKLELESLMKKLGAAGQPVVPPGLEAFVATPAKILESVNAFFENARKDRDHILAALTEEQKLQQALKVAVEREDFEEASRIKQQLNELGPAESVG
jgi:enoyl-CoA hydratase/carnithine racemase